LPRRDTLEALADVNDRGQLQLPVQQVYELRDAAAAHERVAEGHVRGKLVIEIPLDDYPSFFALSDRGSRPDRTADAPAIRRNQTAAGRRAVTAIPRFAPSWLLRSGTPTIAHRPAEPSVDAAPEEDRLLGRCQRVLAGSAA
jgi:hypothetical protein